VHAEEERFGDDFDVLLRNLGSLLSIDIIIIIIIIIDKFITNAQFVFLLNPLDKHRSTPQYIIYLIYCFCKMARSN